MKQWMESSADQEGNMCYYRLRMSFEHSLKFSLWVFLHIDCDFYCPQEIENIRMWLSGGQRQMEAWQRVGVFKIKVPTDVSKQHAICPCWNLRYTIYMTNALLLFDEMMMVIFTCNTTHQYRLLLLSFKRLRPVIRFRTTIFSSTILLFFITSFRL